MSYSRWSNSVWYTFAEHDGSFTICGEVNFSSEDIQDIPKCLEYFKDRTYTEEELQELSGYMKLHLQYYPPPSKLEKALKDLKNDEKATDK